MASEKGKSQENPVVVTTWAVMILIGEGEEQKKSYSRPGPRVRIHGIFTNHSSVPDGSQTYCGEVTKLSPDGKCLVTETGTFIRIEGPASQPWIDRVGRLGLSPEQATVSGVMRLFTTALTARPAAAPLTARPASTGASQAAGTDNDAETADDGFTLNLEAGLEPLADETSPAPAPTRPKTKGRRAAAAPAADPNAANAAFAAMLDDELTATPGESTGGEGDAEPVVEQRWARKPTKKKKSGGLFAGVAAWWANRKKKKAMPVAAEAPIAAASDAETASTTRSPKPTPAGGKKPKPEPAGTAKAK